MSDLVGVDIDTWKLTLCAWNGGSYRPRFATAPLRRRSAESLLDAIRQTAAALARTVPLLQLERTVEFYVERGRGQHRTADFDLGAIYGSTVVALARVCPGAHVSDMEVPEWKRAVTAAVGMQTKRGVPGLGNVPKEVANDVCRRILVDLLPQAERLELTADQLDAFGLVYAAHARAAVAA